MRIGIDITDLSSGIVGVGSTIQSLIEYLDENDSSSKIILYQNDQNRYCSSQNITSRLAYLKPHDYLKEQVYFCARTVLDQLDIFHATINLPPRYASAKTKVVFTVHDLHSEMDKFLFPPQLNQYFSKRRLEAIGEVDAVIVHSEFVRQKVLTMTKIDPAKVHLFPLTLKHGFVNEVSQSEMDRVRKKFKLGKPYFLFVGSWEPWKRVPFVIRAFLEFQKKEKSEVDFVLVGRRGWDHAENTSILKLVNENKNVHSLGYVDQMDLPVIYKMARGFASASTWEGFGLPFLEAMQFGLPVIGAKASAIPEVVGEAGLLFEPHDSKKLSHFFELLFQDETYYNKYSFASLQKSKERAPDEYGQNIHNLYYSLSKS